MLGLAACLIAFPSEVRTQTLSGGPEIGIATAQAQNRGNGRGGNESERGSRSDRDSGRDDGPDRDRSGPDRDRDRGRDRDHGRDRDRGAADRDDRGGREDRGASSPSRGRGRTADVDRSVATPESPAATAIGRALGQRGGDPGPAPTAAGTAHARAMVEIARDLGAVTPARPERPPISGAVTQEMLDAAVQQYVGAVQQAWESHGFPWTDSDVLGSLQELDALVSALESILPEPDGVGGVRVATDFNNDGFVDINDLWDAHRR